MNSRQIPFLFLHVHHGWMLVEDQSLGAKEESCQQNTMEGFSLWHLQTACLDLAFKDFGLFILMMLTVLLSIFQAV